MIIANAYRPIWFVVGACPVLFVLSQLRLSLFMAVLSSVLFVVSFCASAAWPLLAFRGVRADLDRDDVVVCPRCMYRAEDAGDEVLCTECGLRFASEPVRWAWNKLRRHRLF
ncbi:MAG: hypothetical protein AAGI53_14855 [Planctomycetota bacterium]